MTFLMIACAALCVLMLGWVLKPLRTPRAFYALSFLCALGAIGLYLMLGNPELPTQPTPQDTAANEKNEVIMRTVEFVSRLEKIQTMPMP